MNYSLLIHQLFVLRIGRRQSNRFRRHGKYSVDSFCITAREVKAFSTFPSCKAHSFFGHIRLNRHIRAGDIIAASSTIIDRHSICRIRQIRYSTNAGLLNLKSVARTDDHCKLALPICTGVHGSKHGVIFTVSPHLKDNALELLLITMLVVFLHNGLGYLLGYLVGRLFHFNTAKKRTISIEVGMQNAGMATVLSRNFLATPAAIAVNPMAALSVIPCALSCAYHSISGTILAGLFLFSDKRKEKRQKKE